MAGYTRDAAKSWLRFHVEFLVGVVLVAALWFAADSYGWIEFHPGNLVVLGMLAIFCFTYSAVRKSRADRGLAEGTGAQRRADIGMHAPREERALS